MSSVQGDICTNDYAIGPGPTQHPALSILQLNVTHVRLYMHTLSTIATQKTVQYTVARDNSSPPPAPPNHLDERGK